MAGVPTCELACSKMCDIGSHVHIEANHRQTDVLWLWCDVRLVRAVQQERVEDRDRHTAMFPAALGVFPAALGVFQVKLWLRIVKCVLQLA